MNPTKTEKESASLEVVKLHQLVITDDRNEEVVKPSETNEAINEEEIENTEVCLLTFDRDVINNESWMHKKMSGFRTQRATLSVKEKVGKVDQFSRYLISPLKRKYDTVFKATMCTLKAVRSWLKLKVTSSMPNGWLDKREKIYNRLEKLDNTTGYEVTKDKVTKELDEDKTEVEKSQKRVNLAAKIKNSYEAISFLSLIHI